MNREMKKRHFLQNQKNPCFLIVILSGLIIAGVFLIFSFNIRAADNPPLSHTNAAITAAVAASKKAMPIQLRAILHYATSHAVPQQTLDEITLSLDVLRSISPCNFLVFGLGHDSLMWASFNPRGTTLFLEEDPKWIQTILRNAPDLNAHTVNYSTKLSESTALLSSYKSQPHCFPPDNSYLRGNERCRLALSGLPNEVYDKEWDIIMIDAPRGWFPEAPGRMTAIYSAAVMARKRKQGSGVTHVFLHDVERRVENAYAEEFLCRKYLVKGVGRLWHFEIPPRAATVSSEEGTSESPGFC